MDYLLPNQELVSTPLYILCAGLCLIGGSCVFYELLSGISLQNIAKTITIDNDNGDDPNNPIVFFDIKIG